MIKIYCVVNCLGVGRWDQMTGKLLNVVKTRPKNSFFLSVSFILADVLSCHEFQRTFRRDIVANSRPRLVDVSVVTVFYSFGLARFESPTSALEGKGKRFDPQAPPAKAPHLLLIYHLFARSTSYLSWAESRESCVV